MTEEVQMKTMTKSLEFLMKFVDSLPGESEKTWGVGQALGCWSGSGVTLSHSINLN